MIVYSNGLHLNQVKKIYVNIKINIYNSLPVLAQIYEDTSKVNAFFDLYYRQKNDLFSII